VTLDRDFDLIFSCLRTSLGLDAAHTLRERASGAAGCSGFPHIARRHGVLPLVHAALESACPDLVPDGVLREMRIFCAANARRNEELAGELLRLLALFETHAVRAMPFKGPVLAQMLYGSAALRQISDLDIVVPPDEARQAAAALLSAGYRRQEPPGSHEHRSLFDSGKDLIFVRPDRAICVELHWRFSEDGFNLALDSGELWRRLESTGFCGASVRSLQPEDLLLVLCVHGARHQWRLLKWICDIAALIRQDRLDWALVSSRAVSLHIERIVRTGLLLTEELLGVAAPLASAPDPVARQLAREVAAQFSRDQSPTDAARYSFQLRSRERLRDRFPAFRQFVAARLKPTSRDTESLRLPPLLSFIYFLWRPARLAAKYGWRPVRDVLAALLRPGAAPP
jgi:hypothetical protein